MMVRAYWRVTGSVLMVCGAILLATTLAVALRWMPEGRTAIVGCDDGLRTTQLPVHPCPEEA